jgi:predicted CxxxxCH...CXXCH cytochrome family protein
VDAATHVDGAATVVALGCDTCHAAGAPFRATTGATGAADARVGAHDRHLATAIATPLGCADCHLVPGALRHADGAVALAWGPRAAALGAVPSPAAGPIQPGQPVTCANYCHGATLFAPLVDRTPSWTGTLAGCGGCHEARGEREHRNGLHNLFTCSRCHFAVMNAASDTTIANPALHVNGTGDVQLDPAVLGPTGRFTKVGDTWTCTNLCHQDPTIPPNTHSSSVW